MSVVEVSIADHVAIVTLNRPEARNSLNPELILRLSETWRSMAGNDDVRAVVVTGCEGTTFCSGFDLGTSIPLMSGAKKPDNDFEKAITADPSLYAMATLREFDLGRPLIAAVNGHAIAGGFELMLAADIRVVASGVKLGLSEVALGLIPAMGGTARLGRQLPRALAAEFLLTAAPRISDDLEHSGLVNRVVPKDKVLETAMGFARIIAANAPLAVRAARDVIRKAGDLTQEEALALESEQVAVLMATSDAREGPAAFMEKRSPVFQGR
jgi:enoyl-CoA hydratase/carnithine racemase